MTLNTIRCSYNCRGWRSGSDYISTILNSCDVIIQEHWLMPEHNVALNISRDFLSAVVSGMDNNELILECPYGGCGFLYHKSLAPFVTRVQCNSKCFCALYLALCLA